MTSDVRLAPLLPAHPSVPAAGLVDVRRPLPGELAACRLIVPDAFATGTPELLVAVSFEPRRLLGVVAFRDRSSPGTTTWQTQIHVVGPYRRSGVGRRLLGALGDLALRAGVTQLTSIVAGTDTGTAAFLRDAGFRVQFSTETFEVDVQEQKPSVAALYERLAVRGRIPADARVVSLTDAARAPLTALLAARPGAASERHPAHTPPEWSDTWCRPEVLRVSPVVVIADLPIAAVVAERVGTRATVSWRVVAAEHRFGWANILLGHAAFEWMTREGVRTCRFTSTSLTPDTDRMARVHALGAVSCTEHYSLELSPGGRVR